MVRKSDVYKYATRKRETSAKSFRGGRGPRALRGRGGGGRRGAAMPPRVALLVAVFRVDVYRQPAKVSSTPARHLM